MYASCFLSLISWSLDSCVICASYNLFLYVYFSALISSASFRLLMPSYVLPADPLLIFQNYCFPLFSLLRSFSNCYNTHCCNVLKENLQHLRSVLQFALYLHLLLLLPSPDSSYISNHSLFSSFVKFLFSFAIAI